MRCQKCGADNSDSMRFCGQCGQAMAPAAEAPSAAGGASPGTCHDCGYANLTDARFCEGCGTELFEVCPECGKQSRIRVKHCASCGVEKGNFRKSREGLAQAKKLMEEQNFPAVAKVVDQSLPFEYFNEELSKLKEQALSLQKQLDKAKSDANELLQDNDLEHARVKLQVATRLAPNDKQLLAMAAEVNHRIKSTKVDRDLRIARDGLADGNRFKITIKACEKVLKRDPSNKDAKSLKKEAEQIRDEYRARVKESREYLTNFELDKALALIETLKEQFPWDEHLTFSQLKWQQRNEELKEALEEARVAIGDQKYRDVFEACSKVLKIVPKHDEVEDLRKQAQEIKAGHDQGIADAQSCIEHCDYDQARDILMNLLADFPWDERLRPMLDEVDELFTLIEARREEARRLVKKKKWKDAKAAWRRVQRQIPGDQDAADGIELAAKKMKRKAMRVIIGIPLFFFLLAIGGLVGWNFYQLDQAQQTLDDGEAAASQRHLNRMIFPIPAIWEYKPIQEKIDQINAKTLADKKQAAQDSRQAAKEARDVLPAGSDTLAKMTVYREGMRHKLAADEKFEIEEWDEAKEKYDKAAEQFKNAKKLYDKAANPANSGTTPTP